MLPKSSLQEPLLPLPHFLSPPRERLKRSQKSMKAEGSAPAASPCSPSEEVPAAATMTEVKVKTEVPDDYIQEVIWQDDTKDSKKNVKDGAGEVPAEICVVIGGVRNQQTLGSYECGICGKKYKYYNCFQTHVRAHRGTGLPFSHAQLRSIVINVFRKVLLLH
ncbi:hypothetical protein EYD10_12484 [Varanus komodoensis]|nr:hypothetical protein EYD10_12484 [Varanus komodoensis]